MSIHAVIQREMLTMAEDLKDFGGRVIQEPPGRSLLPSELTESVPGMPVAHPVMPLADVVAFISYTTKKLQALEELAVKSVVPER